MSLGPEEGFRLKVAWDSGDAKNAGSAYRLIYGQMQEDAEVERRAFSGLGRVFCIASGGNTSLALAGEHEVVACDRNPVQLQYAQARSNGAMPRRGDAERTLEMARQMAPMVGWRHGTLERFLRMSDVDEQAWFWRAELDTVLFRACCDVLLSHSAMRLIYVRRFLGCLPARFGAVMRARLARGFRTHANVSNPYARALLKGEMMDLPQPEDARLRFVLGDASAYLEACEPGSFDGFALSNILDGADESYAKRLAEAVRHAASARAKVVIRSFREPEPEMTTNEAERDRSLIWGVVDVRPAKEFAGEWGKATPRRPANYVAVPVAGAILP